MPLGETNEEFYQDIYTGQPLPPSSNPPPLPTYPPAWQPELGENSVDGPSWVCNLCTFNNHPLMNKCEQCDMPRLFDRGNTGRTSGKSAEELAALCLNMDKPPVLPK